MPLHASCLDGASGFTIGHLNLSLIDGNQVVTGAGHREDLHLRLNPNYEASHTRDRKRSPPDSACFPGTRGEVIMEITTWADAGLPPETEDSQESTLSFLVVYTPDPHIYWLHGFAGCGKSAVSLKIAEIYEQSGRLLASYFFFRDASDRSTMKRFAVTMASQLACALPATVPFIEAALRSRPGLLSDCFSLTTQLEHLVYRPLQAVMTGDLLDLALDRGPFVIVIDGLDECEDKERAKEFIDQLINFFEENPRIPLRVLLASRVEQHIRERLEISMVRSGDLDRHSAWNDIEKFLRASFQIVAEQDRVIEAYVRARGAWPTASDLSKLIRHIRGSFVLASTIFKFIVQPATEEDTATPMERLPRALELNGLDGLYTEILARSRNLPHFHSIISTITLLKRALPITEISSLIGIEVFEVIRVLLNLQAIISLPATDGEGAVALCHTSLRDFLTTESRSQDFFVPPSFHIYLSYYCFSSSFDRSNVQRDDYCCYHFDTHWQSFTNLGVFEFLREILRFKNRQPLSVDRISHHAFLCSMFFHTFLLDKSHLVGIKTYLLNECADQLVLAAGCADPRVRRWLKTTLDYGYLQLGRSTIQYTRSTHKALRHHLGRALTEMLAHHPGTLSYYPLSIVREKEFFIDRAYFSGRNIFNVLQLIVDRAHLQWKGSALAIQRRPGRPPLRLSITHVGRGDVKLSIAMYHVYRTRRPRGHVRLSYPAAVDSEESQQGNMST